MSSTSCPSWCVNHLTEVIDAEVRPQTSEVPRASVTRGEVTVTVEASPSWVDAPHYLPIMLPEITGVDAASARDYAAALTEAARLLDTA